MNENETEAQNPSMRRPHVVILGAGASVAALPVGDKNGRHVPLMDDLIATLGLESVLRGAGINNLERSFEDVYSEITAGRDNASLQHELDQRVVEYFTEMELPDTPTIYDYLILSLRDKDVIATFNWDPFLFQACMRNRSVANLPHVLFLHGNVAVGACVRDHVKGPLGGTCFRCGHPLKRTRLLYPVAQKNYTRNPYVAGEWSDLQAALHCAYVVTVFGYSAPETDVEAIALLQDAWGPSARRNLEEIELINTTPEDELLATWNPFIHTHHYRVETAFEESWIRRHPRRTCDAMWHQVMEMEFLSDNPAPAECSLEELRVWFEPLIRAEQ